MLLLLSGCAKFCYKVPSTIFTIILQQHQSIRKIFIFVLRLHHVFYIRDRYLTYRKKNTFSYHFLYLNNFVCGVFFVGSNVCPGIFFGVLINIVRCFFDAYKQQKKLQLCNQINQKSFFLFDFSHRKCVKGCLNLYTPFVRNDLLIVKNWNLSADTCCRWVTHEITSYHG